MTRSKWMDSPIKDVLLERFFQDSPILIDEKSSQYILYEGQSFDPDDWNKGFQPEGAKPQQLVLGYRSGPEQCVCSLIHEMAHLAEIDDARILSQGWGLTTPEEYIPGRYSYIASVPNTYQPILRECRVIAMAWQLQNYLGIEETPSEAVSALYYMPDYCHIPVSAKTFDLTKTLRLEWIEKKMLEYCKTYTLQYFFQEWNRKVELLRAHLRQCN